MLHNRKTLKVSCLAGLGKSVFNSVWTGHDLAQNRIEPWVLANTARSAEHLVRKKKKMRILCWRLVFLDKFCYTELIGSNVHRADISNVKWHGTSSYRILLLLCICSVFIYTVNFQAIKLTRLNHIMANEQLIGTVWEELAVTSFEVY
jgi:hypothetical protein